MGTRLKISRVLHFLLENRHNLHYSEKMIFAIHSSRPAQSMWSASTTEIGVGDPAQRLG